MTLAEAKAEGLLDGSPKLKRSTKHVARRTKEDLSRCVQCGEVFDTEVAEVRHMTSCGHHRFEMVLS